MLRKTYPNPKVLELEPIGTVVECFNDMTEKKWSERYIKVGEYDWRAHFRIDNSLCVCGHPPSDIFDSYHMVRKHAIWNLDDFEVEESNGWIVNSIKEYQK